MKTQSVFACSALRCIVGIILPCPPILKKVKTITNFNFIGIKTFYSFENTFKCWCHNYGFFSSIRPASDNEKAFWIFHIRFLKMENTVLFIILPNIRFKSAHNLGKAKAQVVPHKNQIYKNEKNVPHENIRYFVIESSCSGMGLRRDCNSQGFLSQGLESQRSESRECPNDFCSSPKRPKRISPKSRHCPSLIMF